MRGLCAFIATSASAKSKQLAQRIIDAAKSNGVAVFSKGLFEKDFAVVYCTNMPAVLVEYAFHTNAEDRALLSSNAFRDKCADFTAQAICDHLSVNYFAKAETPPDEKPDGYEAWLKCYEYFNTST